jgi:hypothetical protein
MRRMMIALATLPLLAAASPVVVNHDQLTSEVATRIAKSAPNVKVSIQSPLTLKLIGGVHGEATIHLDRVASFCAANSPEDCEAQKTQFIEGVAEGATNEFPVTRDNLRVVVRSAEYAAAMQEALGKGGRKLVTRPVGDGLVALLASDNPKTTRMVATADLEPLGLSEQNAYEMGRKNVLATLPKLPTAAELERGILVFAGQDYDASLLLADGWKELAEQTKGRLFVSVTSDNFVAAGVAEDGDMVRQLRSAAEAGFRSADRAISPEVFRWGDTGWRAAR